MLSQKELFNISMKRGQKPRFEATFGLRIVHTTCSLLYIDWILSKCHGHIYLIPLHNRARHLSIKDISIILQ